ncbi:hypothetical protein [Actinoplanes sp. NPDC049802]|uniref:hypothetical protein n=1 Tax=Actinoplanes sp. NPDC049802 TaxID=3154742 RepID=UPI0033FE4876
MKLTVERRLLCPACGDVLGDATYRRWPGSLTIRAPIGYTINPMAAGIMRRVVERELAEAATEPARELARVRLQYVVDNITDPIYDLRCEHGHSALRTTPSIIRAMTAAQGEWATLE